MIQDESQSTFKCFNDDSERRKWLKYEWKEFVYFDYLCLGMARSGGDRGRAEAVLTCPGEIDDPNFPKQCSKLLNRLQTLLGHGKQL